MADLSITAGSVLANSDTQKESGTCGETLAAGYVVYKSATTGLWMKADNNLSGAKTPSGIALNGGQVNQPTVIAKGGSITVNSVLTAGTAYYLSATAGQLCPVADVTTGMDVALIGIAKSTTVLQLAIVVPGVTL